MYIYIHTHTHTHTYNCVKLPIVLNSTCTPSFARSITWHISHV